MHPHPARVLAGWVAAIWIVLMILQPERTTTITADTLGSVAQGVSRGLDGVLPDTPLPEAEESLGIFSGKIN